MALPEPNGYNNAVPNSRLQDPGLHNNSQNPGPSTYSQHHIPARPVLYFHPPQPPPFLYYPWSMPFVYNPFTGFPGYGMVMPPFPPNPFMEAPAYMLPQPHLQAADCRRLPHPQFQTLSGPFPNPNQTRRAHPSHSAPVRETANSEVQTDPIHQELGGYVGGGGLFASSDSGHGTASDSPNSSSSPQKRDPANGENHPLPNSNAEGFQMNRIKKSTAVNLPHPTGTKSISVTPETPKMCAKDTVVRGNSLSCSKAHYNNSSVSSPENVTPVCVSSQKDEAARERRISIPDILMNWAGGTPKSEELDLEDELLPRFDNQGSLSQTELPPGRSLCQSVTETHSEPAMTDDAQASDAESSLSLKYCETFFKILKPPSAPHNKLEHSREPYGLELNKSRELSDEQLNGYETSLQEDASDVFPDEMPSSGYQMKRKLNESIWSVESLPPCVPSKDWLLQNGLFEPEVIVELTEDVEHCKHSSQRDFLSVRAGQTEEHGRIPCPASLPISESGLLFSTPGKKARTPKKPETDHEICVFETGGAAECHAVTLSGNLSSSAPTGRQSKTTPLRPARGGQENGSSEPEADRSTDRELLFSEQKEKSPHSPEHQSSLLLRATVDTDVPTVQHSNDNGSQDEARGNEKLRGLNNEQATVVASQSKGQLVDCGIQCTKFLELCLCNELMDDTEPRRRHRLNNPEVKMTGQRTDERSGMNGHMQRKPRRHPWKSRGPEKHNSQQEAFVGHSGRPGKSKSKGGNGQNPRC